MLGYLLRLKFKTTLYLCFLLIVAIFSFHQLKLNYYIKKLPSRHNGEKPILLWWTPLISADFTRDLTCGSYQCLLTEKRDYINNSNLAAFLFYASTFIPYDLPVPRKSTDVWAIVHEESPKNLALFLFEDSHGLFNITGTFSRYSNFPLTLQYLPNLQMLTGILIRNDDIQRSKFFHTVTEKNYRLKELAPILYIQSDCMTPAERDSYVVELMKYIKVDSYGLCLNNKKLPEKFTEKPLENIFSSDILQFISQYKFTIAFENAICDDYITEKLWRPLIAGSVPIYLGSPTVEDWLPNKNSVILASNFDSPRSLAEYIQILNANDNLYETYLQHKLEMKIENNFLMKTMNNRHWSTESDGLHFFEAFECYVCEQIHTQIYFGHANLKHYQCPFPISPLTGHRNRSNWWWDHWEQGKREAYVLKMFVERKINFTKDMFYNETERLLLST